MKKRNYKGRCEKRKVSKCEEICKSYSKIQSAIKNSILFHTKRKKELLGEIKMTEKKIEKAWKEYHTIPKEYGYKSVKEFNRSYTNLLEALAVAEKEQKEISTPKGSIRSRLAEKKQKILQSNDNQSPKPAHSRSASL